MAGFSIKFAAGLLDKLLQGEEDVLGDVLLKKLEHMGEEFIMDYIGGPMGTAQRVSKAVRTGGQSEFDRTRDQFLSSLRPRPLPHQGIINKFASFLHAGGKGRRFGRGGIFKRRGKYGWQATDWASSRDDWLDNQWRHDWRSQPRDEHGRWMPGRLDFIAAQLQYRGKHRVGRTVLRRRKLRKMRRLATRRELQKIMKTNRDAS